MIANNIKSGGDINPMVPGQKVTAIFGFCDIRQFTDTTEVLQVRLSRFWHLRKLMPVRRQVDELKQEVAEVVVTCAAGLGVSLPAVFIPECGEAHSLAGICISTSI